MYKRLKMNKAKITLCKYELIGFSVFALLVPLIKVYLPPYVFIASCILLVLGLLLFFIYVLLWSLKAPEDSTPVLFVVISFCIIAGFLTYLFK